MWTLDSVLTISQIEFRECVVAHSFLNDALSLRNELCHTQNDGMLSAVLSPDKFLCDIINGTTVTVRGNNVNTDKVKSPNPGSLWMSAAGSGYAEELGAAADRR